MEVCRSLTELMPAAIWRTEATKPVAHSLVNCDSRDPLLLDKSKAPRLFELALYSWQGGGDKRTVAAAEMSSMSSPRPDQKTPEWRVFTAANLLKRFVVTDDFSVHQIDASPNIMASYKDGKRLSKGVRSVETVDTSFSTVLQRQSSDANEIPRNIQDYTLTVDSDQVEPLHGGIYPGHDLEAMLSLESNSSSIRDAQQLNGIGRSFLAPCPTDGVSSSAIFKYMQHDGRLRDHGKSKQASFRTINHIPHLHISGDHDTDNYHLALFTNDVQYRVSAEDSDDISDMTTGQYTLVPVVDHLGVVNLEIQDEVFE